MSEFNESLALCTGCEKPDANFDFYSSALSTTSQSTSRTEIIRWFLSTWKRIPRAYLYRTYIEILNSINICNGQRYYQEFFRLDILAEITLLNQHETVDNPKLFPMLDNEGNLTVYNGHCDNKLRCANSWQLDKEYAIEIGQIYAMLYHSPIFYCVSGKIRLKDVIGLSYGKRYVEIYALQRNVQRKQSQLYQSANIPLSPDWELML